MKRRTTDALCRLINPVNLTKYPSLTTLPKPCYHYSTYQHESFTSGHWELLVLLVSALPNIVVGILLLVNLGLSLMDWDGRAITGISIL